MKENSKMYIMVTLKRKEKIEKKEFCLFEHDEAQLRHADEKELERIKQLDAQNALRECDLSEADIMPEVVSIEALKPEELGKYDEKDEEGFNSVFYYVSKCFLDPQYGKMEGQRDRRLLAIVEVKTEKSTFSRTFMQRKHEEMLVYQYVSEKMKEKYGCLCMDPLYLHEMPPELAKDYLRMSELGYYVMIYDVYAGAVESKGEKVCIGRRNKRIANVLLKTKKPPLMRMFVEAKQDEIAVYEYVTRKLREEFDEEGRVVIFNVEEDLTGTIEDLIEADGLESRVFCVKRANDTDGGLVECEWPKLEKTENDAGIL